VSDFAAVSIGAGLAGSVGTFGWTPYSNLMRSRSSELIADALLLGFARDDFAFLLRNLCFEDGQVAQDVRRRRLAGALSIRRLRFEPLLLQLQPLEVRLRLGDQILDRLELAITRLFDIARRRIQLRQFEVLVSARHASILGRLVGFELALLLFDLLRVQLPRNYANSRAIFGDDRIAVLREVGRDRVGQHHDAVLVQIPVQLDGLRRKVSRTYPDADEQSC